MGFFGTELSSTETQCVEIPEGWQLRLCNAVLKLEGGAGRKKADHAPTTTTVNVIAGEDGDGKGSDEFALCHLDPAKCVQWQCSLVFADVDSPLYLRTDGPGTVHVTGCFERDPFADDEDGDEEGDSEEGFEDEDDEVEAAYGEHEADDNDAAFDNLLQMVHARRMRDADDSDSDSSGDSDDSELEEPVDEYGRPRVELLSSDDETAGGAGAHKQKKKKRKDRKGSVGDDGGAAAAAAAQPAAAAGSDIIAAADGALAAAAAAAAAAAQATAAAADANDHAAAATPAAAADAAAERRKQKRKERKCAAEEEKKRLKEAFGAGEGGKAGAGGGAAAATEGPVKLPKPVERRLAGGLIVKDKVLGAGKVASSGKQVKVLYEGSFPDGRVFDKNFNRRAPLGFRVGLGRVIKGMERGVEGMRVGGQREVYIPAALAYGKSGAGPIGPNQDLVFHIELVDVGGR
ncbi:hypothetical protein JKP88DRAFT_339857 [Tribonema minus]|uniref:peptidylprolyl isomerase n=1 Tax=Tribonema minus TaxID=303371 RepID=A0A835YI76_9STRA|nr:hypothetical protein JKP88DRAFT_339857 [Tribonema minus]